MALSFKKAVRKRVRLKIGMSAPAGGGKTLSSLILAYGLLKGEHPDWSDEQIWGAICIMDSENASAELYTGYDVVKSGVRIGEFNVIPMEAPFTADTYISGINLAKENGIEVCIIDSLTPLWNGVGGMLEKQGNISKRSGNSYTAWREITPEFNRFVDTMLQTDMHIIATMRSKTDYVQEKDDKGHTTIKKVGLAPVMRDGMEYEFSIFLDIDTDHMADVSKDRTGVVEKYADLHSKYFTVTPELGKSIADWLSGGATVEKKPEMEKSSVAHPFENPVSTSELEELKSQIGSLAKELVESGNVEKSAIADIVKSKFVVNGKPTANYNAIKDASVARDVLSALETLNK